MGTLVTIAPHEVFKDIVNTIRETQTVDTFVKVGNITSITCDTTNIMIGNFVEFDCGDLQGEYQVLEKYTDSIKIKYSGYATTGTMYSFPFFDWGNLKDGKIEILKKREYPLIFMLLPNPYNVNIDDNSPIYIEDYTFKFFVVNRYMECISTTEKTKSEYIYNNLVKQAAQISDRFAKAVKDYKLISRKGFKYKRSEEIPFGVTFGSNENGKTEALFEPKTAGCYLEIRVSILKTYQC
jgi:hypothetical protein